MPSRSIAVVLRTIPFAIILVGFASFVGLSALRTPPETRMSVRRPPGVSTVPVVTSGTSLELEVEGEVVPAREVTLAAEVVGRIQKKTPVCRAGNFANQDCVLLQIDPRDYDLEIQRIQQSIAETEVSIEESDVQAANNAQLIELSKSDLALQAKELKRVESLLSQRVTSQSTLDTARRAEIQARNALQLRENQDRLIRTQRGRYLRAKDRLLVELEKAMLDRKRTEIRAPMAGIITEDLVEQDDYVQKGTALVRIEDTSHGEVSFDLKLDELRWIWAGVSKTQADSNAAVDGDSYALPPLPVKIEFHVQGTIYEWGAVLARYDGAGLNPATRTVPCVAHVDDPRSGRLVGESGGASLPGPPALLRGMFVTVKIDVPTSQQLVEVPISALRPGNRVWILRDDRLAVQDVRVAQVLNDRVLLIPDETQLAVGDRVIISPLALAVDGMEILEEEMPGVSVADQTSDETRNATKAVATEIAR